MTIEPRNTGDALDALQERAEKAEARVAKPSVGEAGPRWACDHDPRCPTEQEHRVAHYRDAWKARAAALETERNRQDTQIRELHQAIARLKRAPEDQRDGQPPPTLSARRPGAIVRGPAGQLGVVEAVMMSGVRVRVGSKTQCWSPTVEVIGYTIDHQRMTGGRPVSEKAWPEMPAWADDADEGKECVMHAWQAHGKEAEELRTGVEALLSKFPHHTGWDETSTDEAYEGLRDALQELLDDVDARDSLAYLERREATKARAK